MNKIINACLFGSLNGEGSQEVTTAYIRNLQTGVYLDPGEMVWKWDSDNARILVDKDSVSLPSGVTYVQDDQTRFTFTIH